MNYDFGINLIFGIALVFAIGGIALTLNFAYADNSTAFNGTGINSTKIIIDPIITNQTNPIIENQTTIEPIKEPDYASWFDLIFQRLSDMQVTLTNLGESAIASIPTPEIEIPFTEEKKQATLKDCTVHEKLKKDWFDCTKFNQGIASERMTEERIDNSKEISRGF
jgi:hypothetical protein